MDAECLIPSPGYICLNEAQLSEWSGGSNLDLADVRVPENRKNWAIAAAHSQSMFTNMIGAEITSIDYFFAQAIIEGRMGCDAGIITDPLDDNPINYRSISSAAGCFQILPDGMNQLKRFTPIYMVVYLLQFWTTMKLSQVIISLLRPYQSHCMMLLVLRSGKK